MLKNKYIEDCLMRIEEQYFPEKKSRGEMLSQRDFEFLIKRIEEKSGVKVSLSTLKRLWKGDYDYRPHQFTLNALAGLLDFEDWHAFTARYRANTIATKKTTSGKNKKTVGLVIAILISLVFVSFIIILPKKEDPLHIPKEIAFTVDKTMVNGVPNTVIFNYDLKGAVADSFSIQRSWNPKNRTSIDKTGTQLTEVYYFPGFHWAKLMANDSTIAKQRIHVTTDGWLATAKYNRLDKMPVYLNKDILYHNGQLRVSEKNFKDSGFDNSREMVLSYFNINEFENMDSGDFEIETRVKLVQSKTVCPYIELAIIDEKDISWFPITERGCEGTLSLKVGDTFISGKKNDLSEFGIAMNQWNTIRLTVENQMAHFYVNKSLAFQVPSRDIRGNIMGINFHFSGEGVVDYVRLKDLKSGKTYNEEF